MITTFQNAIKALMIMKATARPESGKADEIEGIIQQIILGEQMLSDEIEEAHKHKEKCYGKSYKVS